MAEPRDMDAPVTRREMHEALETWGGAIIERLTSSLTRLIVASEQRMTAAMVAMEGRLMNELGRATRASEAELTTRIKVVDEQYTDLPGRVTRLEAKVFAPPKRKRRASR
jgi:hypothetical protein